MGLLDFLLRPAAQGGQDIFKTITTPPPTSSAGKVFAPPVTATPTVAQSIQSQIASPIEPAPQDQQGIIAEKGLSMRIYRVAEDIAAQIRGGIPKATEAISKIPIVGKPLAAVTPYTTESVVRMIQMGGMIPGGVETLARKPEIIPAMVIAGAGQAVTGTIKSATEEPKQFISDIATGVLLGHGVTKLGGAIPLPKYVEVKVPTTAGTAIKPIYETVYRGIAIGERPIIGITRELGIPIPETPTSAQAAAFGRLRMAETIGSPLHPRDIRLSTSPIYERMGIDVSELKPQYVSKITFPGMPKEGTVLGMAETIQGKAPRILISTKPGLPEILKTTGHEITHVVAKGGTAESTIGGRYIGEPLAIKGSYVFMKEMAKFYGGEYKMPTLRESLAERSGLSLKLTLPYQIGEVLSRLPFKPVISSEYQLARGGLRAAIGAPKVIGIEAGKILPGYFPQTVLETRVMGTRVMKSLGMASTEIEKLTVGRKLIDITQKQKSAFIRELPAETKTLPKEGVAVVKDVLKENKAQVEKIAGSYAAQSQMMPEHVRVPGDIDLYLKTDKVKAEAMTKEMLSKLQEKGIDAQIDPNSPTRIVTRGTEKEWVHAVELHYTGEIGTAETVMVGSPKVGDIRYGYAVEQAPVMVEGFPTMRLSEQAIRKVTGSLEWHPSVSLTKETLKPTASGLKLSPAGHRLKDITDAYFVQKTLIESKKVSPIRRVVEAGKIKKGEALLKRWKELYPEAAWEKPAVVTEEFTIKGVSTVIKRPLNVAQLIREIPAATKASVIPAAVKLKTSSTISTPSAAFERVTSPIKMPSKVSLVEEVSGRPSGKVSIKPSAKVSDIFSPSKIPSRIPGSKIPSKVPSGGRPSKVPSSKIPSKIPSPEPSKTPSPKPSPEPSPYAPPYVQPYSSPSSKVSPQPKLIFPSISSITQRIFKPSETSKRLGKKKKLPEKETFLYGEKAAIATTKQMFGAKK